MSLYRPRVHQRDRTWYRARREILMAHRDCRDADGDLARDGNFVKQSL